MNWQSILDAFGLSENDTSKVQAYLQHYGYLKGNFLTVANSAEQSITSFADALKKLQAVAGLEPTGQVDEATKALMGRPRCGCLDVQRLNAAEARWRKKSLTYKVEAYVNGLSQADQDAILELAWKQWMDVADIKITRVVSASPADITISVGRGASSNFDGPSGTLAWAYLPSGNDSPLLMRFDLDEKWVKDNPNAGILMLNVAAHEFGHLLGLDHSQVSTALMAPYYSPQISKPQTRDDVQRIQSLYGVATTTPSPPVSPPTTPTNPGKKLVMFEIDGEITNIMAPGFKVTKV